MRRRNEPEGLEDETRLRGIGGLIAVASLGTESHCYLPPGSGEEARDAIGRSYRKTKKCISRRAEDLGDRLEDSLDQASDASRSKLRRLLRRREAERLHLA